VLFWLQVIKELAAHAIALLRWGDISMADEGHLAHVL
jgi:hypothetical protein